MTIKRSWGIPRIVSLMDRLDDRVYPLSYPTDPFASRILENNAWAALNIKGVWESSNYQSLQNSRSVWAFQCIWGWFHGGQPKCGYVLLVEATTEKASKAVPSNTSTNWS